MIPTAPGFRLFFFAFCLLIFNFCCAYPTPCSHTSTEFLGRETGLTSPVTVTRTERINTDAGTFIRTCTITLTPTVVDGMDMVRQEKTCVVMPDNGNGGVPGAPPPGSSSTESTQPPSSTSTTSPTLTGSTDTPSPTSSVVPSNTTDLPPSTTTNSPPSTITNSPPAGSGTVPPPVISTTLSSVPRPDSSSLPSPLPSSTDGNSVGVPPSGAPAVVIGISSVSMPTTTPQPGSTDSPAVNLPQSSSSPSPTPTSENAGAPAPFEPPGKKLEVLPIGLGVFAGVSVIALFVVGIVTYERTKHRRNFRKLKLQEAGSRMGYGAT